MNLQWIPPHRIELSWIVTYSRHSPMAMVNLTNSIATVGLLNPVIVRLIPRTGWFWFLKVQRYELIDGRARVDVAKALKLPLIPVQIIDSTDEQLRMAEAMSSK